MDFKEVIWIISTVFIGILLGYTMCADGRSQDIHALKVEAIIMECAHWTAEGEFDWNGPHMDDLHEVKTIEEVLDEAI